MRILVAGGAGFLGSNLCRKLFWEGHEVFCLDNLSTGSESNLKELIMDSNFHFINDCVESPIWLEVEQIYNFASPASPSEYKKNPEGTVRANVVGTMNLLSLARTLRIPMLQISTMKVGEPVVLNSDSCYVESKRCAEVMCYEYRTRYEMDIKIARLFNTYGPLMALGDTRVIPQFVRQALRGEDLVIYGDGKQTDSFCFVEDVIQGLVLYMNAKVGYCPIEFGGAEEIPISVLAESIVKTAKSLSVIRFKGSWEGQKSRKPDLTRAKSLFNWEPKISLLDGLEITVEYFRQGLSSG